MDCAHNAPCSYRTCQNHSSHSCLLRFYRLIREGNNKEKERVMEHLTSWLASVESGQRSNGMTTIEA